MARSSREVVSDVRAILHNPSIASVDDDNDLLIRLDALAIEYFALPTADKELDVWFQFYERFPNDTGHGIFWSILHGIESQKSSNSRVVASVLRNPTHFPMLMVNRLLNAGITEVDGVNLLKLLRQVIADERVTDGVREDARLYLERRE